MLLVVSDTHSTDTHRLTDHLEAAVEAADIVIHAGDFMRESVLDSFLDRNGSLRGVYGNTDDEAIRSRLPAARTVEYGGVRFAVTHTRRGGKTALSMFGRERDADAVIFGHSHRPTVDTTGQIALLNPGSHTQPRGNRPGYAELEPIVGGVCGRLLSPSGEPFREFQIRP